MSDSLYNPDDAAQLVQPWDEAFRAQRDVGLRIPINYLTVPAVSLTGACFSHNQYENNAFQKCISNLLASGFRRYLLDVYWDSGRSVWSLCPVGLPANDAESNRIKGSSILTVSTTSSIAKRGVAETRAALWPTALPNWKGALWHRQDDASSEAATSSPSASSGSLSIRPSSTIASAENASVPTTTGRPASFMTFPTNYDAPLIQIGSYNCTSLMTLDFLTGILEDYIDDTDTTTAAAINYLFIRLHAASNFSEPDAPVQQVPAEHLPRDGSFVADIIKGNLSSRLFTPNDLRDERSNLNDTWYNVREDNQPDGGYFSTSVNSADNLVTDNGWPTEAYAEFKNFWRLVASYLEVDQQLSLYNISRDFDTVFPPEEIRLLHNVTISPSGGVTSGCLFNPSDITITAESNSSWAVGVIPSVNIGPNPNVSIPVASVANVTWCGISPFLNSSISGLTADQHPVPYLAYAHSTLWSWIPGEPANATVTNDKDDEWSSSCVIMTPDAPYPGRWRTANCEDRHRIACQNTENPYQWEVSEGTMSYFNGDSGCRENTTFSVPHTALENQHLFAALSASALPDTDNEIFVNLNSINVGGCWVEGIDGTCPYTPRTDNNRTRIVVVPTVAAVIICVLAALTFFVKCAANRREGRRAKRRRNVGGWDYEGVPS